MQHCHLRSPIPPVILGFNHDIGSIFVLASRYVAPFANKDNSKGIRSENRGGISEFFTPVKIGGGWVSAILIYYLEPNLRYTFGGILLGKPEDYVSGKKKVQW